MTITIGMHFYVFTNRYFKRRREIVHSINKVAKF